MMNKVLLIIAILGISMLTKAQDDIKIMQYNLLNYGNITSYCTTTNNNLGAKEGYLRTILSYVKPDVFTVNELAANTYVVNRLLDSVMNKYSTRTYGRADYVNTNGSNLVNMLYYNKAKLVYVSATSLQNELRDIVWYKLYYKSPNLAQSQDTAWLNFIVGHLKAGSSSSDKVTRDTMTSRAMNYLEQHNIHGNITFQGDFNLKTSTEKSYQNIINFPNATYRFYDPLNRPGKWNNSSSFAAIHTQSTHSSSNGCAAGGGLDDRFDFILISNDLKQGNAHVQYKSGSYTVVGNDGHHFNKSINYGSNNSAPSNIINSLYNMSDHLPVTMLLHLDAQVSAIHQSNGHAYKVNFQNPVSNTLVLDIASDGKENLQIELWSLNGKKLLEQSEAAAQNIHLEMSLNQFASGMYILHIRNQRGERIYTSKIVKY